MTLTLLTAIVVRAEYASGKRGKEHAWRHGLTAAQYNAIGRKRAQLAYK